MGSGRGDRNQRPASPHAQRPTEASMGSGRGDRNQGSPLGRPLSCDDTGPRERWLTSTLADAATDPTDRPAWPLTWARALPRTPVIPAPLAPVTRSVVRCRAVRGDARGSAPRLVRTPARGRSPPRCSPATPMTAVTGRDGPFELRSLSDGQVAEEHRVLQPLTMVLHQRADPAQRSWWIRPSSPRYCS